MGVISCFETFNSIVGVNFEHKGSHTVLVLILDIFSVIYNLIQEPQRAAIPEDHL